MSHAKNCPVCSATLRGALFTDLGGCSTKHNITANFEMRWDTTLRAVDPPSEIRTTLLAPHHSIFCQRTFTFSDLVEGRRDTRRIKKKIFLSPSRPFFSSSKLLGTTARLKGPLPEAKCFFLRRRQLLDIHRGLSSASQKKGDTSSSYAGALLLSHSFSPLAPHVDRGIRVFVPSILLDGRDEVLKITEQVPIRFIALAGLPQPALGQIRVSFERGIFFQFLTDFARKPLWPRGRQSWPGGPLLQIVPTSHYSEPNSRKNWKPLLCVLIASTSTVSPPLSSGIPSDFCSTCLPFPWSLSQPGRTFWLGDILLFSTSWNARAQRGTGFTNTLQDHHREPDSLQFLTVPVTSRSWPRRHLFRSPKPGWCPRNNLSKSISMWKEIQ